MNSVPRFRLPWVRVVDARRLAGLRAQGFGWKKISREMKVGVGTLYQLTREGSKTRKKVFGTP